MSPKNCMVAQSGGPTVAINASLAGVIDGVMRSDMYDTVYGSLNGITGILNNDLTNLSELMQQNSEYPLKGHSGNVSWLLPLQTAKLFR